MDSLTQIVLGAAVGEVVLGRKVGNKAMLYGAIAGTIPDLDVLARSFMDALSANEVHRGLTHSLLFCLITAPLFGLWVKKHVASFLTVFTLLLAAVFLQNPKPTLFYVILASLVVGLIVLFFSRVSVPKEVSAADWSKLFFWSLVTHPILDCYTTWGTQFFWPFPVKIAFNNIFVADPLYTVPFLVCVIVAMFYTRGSSKRMSWNRWGIIISSVYMMFTLIVKFKVHTDIADSLARQSIEYQSISTRPAPLQTVLWIGNVEGDEDFKLCMHSLLDTKPEVEFVSVPKNHHLLGKWSEHETIERLRKLTDGKYTISENDSALVFNDLRFGQLGEPAASKDFIFRYVLYEQDGELRVKMSNNPNNDDSVDMKALMVELWERIKGE